MGDVSAKVMAQPSQLHQFNVRPNPGLDLGLIAIRFFCRIARLLIEANRKCLQIMANSET